MTSGSSNPAPPPGSLPSASSTWAAVAVSPSDASASISPWWRPEGFLRESGVAAARLRFGTYGTPLAPTRFRTIPRHCSTSAESTTGRCPLTTASRTPS
jgi:hypothetical protein